MGRGSAPSTTTIVGAGIVFLLAALALWPREAESHHPEPRAGVAAEHVVPAARYAADPYVAQVYAYAAEVPAVLDGLQCYCFCDRHSGHYSLLDCFKSDHGAGCDICLEEAEMAYRMAREGRSLDEIRAAIDQAFGHYAPHG